MSQVKFRDIPDGSLFRWINPRSNMERDCLYVKQDNGYRAYRIGYDPTEGTYRMEEPVVLIGEA